MTRRRSTTAAGSAREDTLVPVSRREEDGLDVAVSRRDEAGTEEAAVSRREENLGASTACI